MKLQEFLKSAASPELVKEAKNQKTADELMKFASEHDVEITKEEADKFISRKVELSQDELDAVAGGRSYYNHNPEPICPKCGGHLECLDGPGESHFGCGGDQYYLFKCQSCGEKFDWFVEAAGWADD